MPVLTAPRLQAETPSRALRPKTIALWAAAIFAAYLILAFGDALVALPWCDEAWLSNPALTFLRKGYLGTPILTQFGWGPPENLLHIQQRTYWIMPLHMLTQIVWYRVFGYSLLALRSLSIVWGTVALGALASIVFLLTRNAGTALLALAIAGTDYFYLTRAIDGRMDMMAAALMLSGFAYYLYERERNLTRAVAVSGILAAASFFTHPVAGFFALCGSGFLGLYFDRRRLRLRHIVLFGLPFAVMGAAWGVYIAQDVAAFRLQMSGNAQGRWEGMTNLSASVYREIRYKYFQAFGLNTFASPSLQHLRLVALASYLAAAAAVALTPALRALRGIRALLWITFIFVFGGMLFDGAKRWYYLLYVVPFFVALLAVWVNWLWEQKRIPRGAVAAATAAFLLIQVGGTAYRIKKNDYKNKFLPAMEFLKTHNPNHEAVNGEGEAGFALGFPDYLIDDVSLGYFSRQQAKFIFIPETYWGLWMGNMKDRDPAVSRHIEYTLSHDYTLAYDHPPYKIYERKN
jgi:4-amino-4-deoxy-L-arabinose transferase-like glycosyltransferase